ncbi:hypothetical protein PS631_00107 [Pseudomonas fluorescens]|uniref:Uncharacterized protein n=1 Tax=Pseudomonas fluorescens TaxID=294 RepID=A0A5E6P700_PSEFL|nr:hypothetical protein [Pseudomonas fluorescens]VVM37514.1 hypothetical protein PS631_00107 [Pseudomonas fluorescens]
MDTNKMRDISREQFEVWARDENKWLIDRDSFGNYIYGFVRDSWNSWQASREAVVVELPKFDEYPSSMEHDMRESLRSAIEAQSLKVAP